MGQYKVIQDIEAEDKLLGPLTLRQFIYAIIVVVSCFMGFKLITATAGKWYLAIPLIPHTIFFAVLAAPFGHDQSNEVWLLAKIRFALKPRRRIWDQSGIKELVTITVPKQIEKHLTKGFSQEEVASRLEALANTIDSRGWAVKNVNSNLFQQPAYAGIPDSDRLVRMSDMPREVPIEDLPSSFDVLDEFTNPTMRTMDQLMSTSEQAHHQQLVNMMQAPVQQVPTAPQQQWFTTPQSGGMPNQVPTQLPAQPVMNYPVQQQQPVVAQQAPQYVQQMPQPTQQVPLPVAQPIAQMPVPQQPIPAAYQPPAPVAQPASNNPYPHVPPVTPVTDPAIINLATNDDLSVATIARQADKVAEQHNDEVVVSLH